MASIVRGSVVNGAGVDLTGGVPVCRWIRIEPSLSRPGVVVSLSIVTLARVVGVRARRIVVVVAVRVVDRPPSVPLVPAVGGVGSLV